MGQGEPRERVVRPHGPRRAVVLRHFRRQAPQNTCGFIYKRAANTFQGNAYEADDSRPEDCEMDGKKFATMLMTNVFPAIRKNISGAKLVTVQMDNTSGHMLAWRHYTRRSPAHSRLARGAALLSNLWIIRRNRPTRTCATLICSGASIRSSRSSDHSNYRRVCEEPRMLVCKARPSPTVLPAGRQGRTVVRNQDSRLQEDGRG